MEGRSSNADSQESPRPSPSVFRVTEYSILRSISAFLLLVGAPHLNAVLILTAIFILPARFAATVLFMLLLLGVAPVNDKSKLGEILSTYICRFICAYFPVTLHVEDIKAFDAAQSYGTFVDSSVRIFQFHVEDIKAFDAAQSYVFGYEPHSLIPYGFCALSNYMGLLPLTKVKFLASSSLFHVPFMRHIWTWFGFIPASRQNFCSNLKAGYSCVVIPGGQQEMLYMDTHNEVAYIKSRKGFIKIAMETGRPLVPVVCFGQTHIYKWWTPNVKIGQAINRAIKLVPIIYWGRFCSPIPLQQPIHVVVGKPIMLKIYPQPTMDEINEVHMEFISKVEGLFEKYKTRAGYCSHQLRIL